MGNVFFGLGQLEKAKQFYQNSLSIGGNLASLPENADSAVAFNNLGLILENEGNSEEALSYYV